MTNKKMSGSPTIVVVGSSNTDMVIKADHLPSLGETIIGKTFFMNPGGKGANQAVAAARLGGNVTFITKTGNDIFGKQSERLFSEEGINTSYMVEDPDNPSGVALITVDRNAENCIVVAPGANGTLMPGDLKDALQAIQESSVVVMQLEIPLDTVQFVAEKAASNGVKVLLNPAPALELPDSLLRNLYMITPNRKEAEMLSGIQVTDIESAKQAAKVIKDKGVEIVVVTLGADGAIVVQEDVITHVSTYPVNAIDTTAAGDVFNGALAVSIAENKDVLAATVFACKAAALSVTKMGAQNSIPNRIEVDSFKIPR
jgi:ribokinase